MSFCENCGKSLNSLNERFGLLKDTKLCGKCKPMIDDVFSLYSKEPETGIEEFKSNYAKGRYPNITKNGYDHMISGLNVALEKKKDKELLEQRLKEQEERKKELELKEFEIFQKYSLEEQNRVRSIVSKLKEEDFPVYLLKGARGRNMRVYRDRCVIKTDANIGALITGNATDGEKTIFFHDVIGIQFKIPGITLGYLQLETASGMGNNEESNMFAENTFTFEGNIELMEDVKDYIVYQVSQYKQLNR